MGKSGQNTRSRKSSPSLYSGIYKNYLRLFIPRNAVIESITVDSSDENVLSSADIASYNDKMSIGLLVEVAEKTDKKVIMNYTLSTPETSSFTYQLMVQKQPGTENDLLVVNLGNNAREKIQTSTIDSFPHLTSLRQDRLITVDFKR